MNIINIKQTQTKMKKYILMPLLAVFALTATAQDFDTDPTLELENAEK